MAKQYTGEKINVYFEPKRCVHATECVRGLGKVFDVDKRPWVQPDNAPVEDVIKVVERCPSGALTYELPSNERETHAETRVTYGDDGEIFIYGDFDLVHNGEVMHLNRAILTSDESNTDNPPFYSKSFSGQGDKEQFYKQIQDEEIEK
ncbi:(4Fe-4S)-binding protein [Staphylococcus cornubiensis]|uniref:(4Fe-4S)-binding protein n=1 Tax=Staphylococcus cornubiensis TaxID=1986155 RepID=UPI000A3674C3|nr:(4Fe-4S)-binding protein [Staphylococcus cornubiensis]